MKKKSFDPLPLAKPYHLKHKVKGKGEGVDKNLYKKLGINNLIIFCIHSVTEKKERCTFERLIEECFSLFTEVFSFPHLSKWPDSRKLDRPLRTLRRRKLITGDPQKFFSLTESGKKIAEEITKTFRQRRLQI